jgi:acetyl esterase/lipase
MTTRPLLSLLFAITLGAVTGAQTDCGAATNARREKAQRALLPVPGDVQVESDIVYKTVGGEKLALDLYRVNGRKYDKAPLVIWIHGGGYVKGSKEGAVKHNAELMVPLLMEHGYLVASLDYRFVALKGPKLVDCMTDCMDAVRFLAKNSARFGIDPARMVSIGSSAGGGLATMMALAQDGDLPGDPELAKTSAHARAAVSWFGVTDFLKAKREASRSEEHFAALFDMAQAGDRQYEIASPVWHMRRRTDKVPVLLVHGDGDKTVPFQQSVWMKAEADRLGWPVEFMPVKNMRHGFQSTGTGEITPPLSEIWKRTLDFILKNNP